MLKKKGNKIPRSTPKVKGVYWSLRRIIHLGFVEIHSDIFE